MKKLLILLLSVIFSFGLLLQLVPTEVLADDYEFISDLIYDGSKYISVGCPGIIRYSTDLKTWKDVGTNLEDDCDLIAIAYGANRYVAVGAYDSTWKGLIITSDNGYDWAKVDIGEIPVLLNVTWNGTQFAACGEEGAIYTSKDGNIWTKQESNTTLRISDMIWDGNRYIAVANDFESYMKDGNSLSSDILISADGVSWNKYINNEFTTLNKVASNGNVIVTSGFEGSIFILKDNEAWSILNIDEENKYVNDLKYIGSMFIAIGGKPGKKCIWTSKDGLIWTEISLDIENTFISIIWDGQQYIATYDYGLSLVKSKDGEQWEKWNGSSFTAIESTITFTDKSSTVVPSSRACSNASDLINKLEEVHKVIADYKNNLKISNTKPTNIKDANGNIVANFNYRLGVLRSLYYVGYDNNYMTTYFDIHEARYLTVYGKQEDLDIMDAARKEIRSGTYDFVKNEANVACIYLYVYQVKETDLGTLKKIIANPSLTDEEIAKIKDDVSALYDTSMGLAIGYTLTPELDDGKKVYGSVMQIGDEYRSFEYEVKGSEIPEPTPIPDPISRTKGASSWAAAEIEKAIDAGLVTVKILSDYQSNITREEFCEIAVKLYEQLSGKKAEPISPNPFTDTTNSEILKAYNLKISNGKSDTEFKPNDPITRQELCVMIRRALQAAMPNLVINTEGGNKFNDDSDIAGWAVNDVRFCNLNGIIGGVGNNLINPKGNTTREQAILMLYRAYAKFVK